MAGKSLTIWCNAQFSADAERILKEGTRKHRLVRAAGAASVLTAGGEDSALESADIAFGQPDAGQCVRSENLKWIEVTSAGYTRYDNEPFREELRRRGAVFTNASSVFSEPCAQHALAMMLALGRRLPGALDEQRGERRWLFSELRSESRLMAGETVLMLGFGAIGRRLAELLAPFRMKIFAVRRKAYSEAGVHVISEERVSSVIAEADHVINILPDNESTRNYVNARRLSWCKRGAKFYNIGRGTTVDQGALIEALESGKLGAAYLDVMEPEPLPPSHPLWTTRNCHITPHTAGGRSDQDETLVRHFLKNLAAFETGAGAGEFADRVI
ncbi:dehydrogenase [Nibricoccus aquaticus]|uniref:Dehydrogenase n=1 Tax=Nibricoccus aquaticus TaxID=2576891 RepID=A0A290Q693_9BACT|nr:D-2-hydroxyacid dehydrogenase [Nibricoccus aquaticus]ATC64189.1 dehydrogenase [Nibricoccus aquaticus]